MGINGLVVFRILYPVLRWLGWSAVLLYFVAALGLLGLRFVVLPNIDQYAPAIETRLSAALGARVHLGGVKVQWHHLNPNIELTQVRLSDQQGRPLLTIPHVDAVVSWRSFFSMTPQFMRLRARGVDLSVQRDLQGHLQLLGRTVGAHRESNTDTALGATVVQWLTSQRQIVLQDSTLRWIDASRGAEPLVLTDVQLNIRNQGQQHRFSLVTHPPAHVGERFDIRGDLTRAQDARSALALETGEGQLYFSVDGLRPDAWRRWVDLPAGLSAAKASARVWLTVGAGAVDDVAAAIVVDGAQWQITDTHRIEGNNARAFVRGGWEAFYRLTHAQPTETATDSDARFTFQVQGRGIGLVLEEHYEHVLKLDAVEAAGSAGRSAQGFTMDAHKAAVANTDAEAAGSIRWSYQPGQGPGHIDVSGRIHRADLGAVHRYMPIWVDAEVRQWLQQGLPLGQLHDADLTLRGELNDFPFETPESEGDFRIRGPYRGAVVDYLPPNDEDQGWPRLDAMDGQLDLHGASLRIKAHTGRVEPDDETHVELADVEAHIDNLRDDPVLQVSGETTGDASAYLAFMRNSPLGGMLNHVFDPAQASGEWDVPLQLTIPLARATDTSVQGSVHMNGTQVRFEPQLPVFTEAVGTINFTQDVVTVHDVTASLLGQKARIAGGIGPEQPGLHMTGKVTAKALADLVDVPGMQRFAGTSSYTATLTGVAQQDPDQSLTIEVTSDLNGLAMDFPPPLHKPSDQKWPLRIVWAHGSADDARTLEVHLGAKISARFEHRRDPAAPAYFQAGRIGVGQAGEWSEKGLNVDIEHPVFDGDAWDSITKEFVASDSRRTGRPLFPKVRALRLQTEKGRLLGLDLDKLTYTVKETAVNEWRADVSSTGTAGTLTWEEKNDQIDGPVQAVFHRLAFGRAGSDTAEDAGNESGDKDINRADNKSEGAKDDGPDVADDLRIPAINLIIENLELYGRQVGKLALVGVNEARGNVWRLQQVSLTSPSAHLEGAGVWRLRGPGRGLTLDASVDVSNLGSYFDQIGFQDMLSAGEGKIDGVIEWRDLPWSFDKSHIKGDIDFSLAKGRLSTLNSRSARLLELLSLQSIRRLATLDLNPLNLSKDGFPYDVLRGSISLNHGTVRTEDYRIVGPVGTIVLDGVVALSTGKLDLRAVVVPNLDVSGAAIAAGIAINPVVGIGAFLTQWLLKEPLAEAMTAQYEIGGDWDDPEITAVERITSETPDPVAH